MTIFYIYQVSEHPPTGAEALDDLAGGLHLADVDGRLGLDHLQLAAQGALADRGHAGRHEPLVGALAVGARRRLPDVSATGQIVSTVTAESKQVTYVTR